MSTGSWWQTAGHYAIPIASGAIAAVGLPVAIGAIGFTGAGITAGSIAAKLMSVSAIANGGGVAAGGLVATLQSVGAVGLGAKATTVVGCSTAAVVKFIRK